MEEGRHEVQDPVAPKKKKRRARGKAAGNVAPKRKGHRKNVPSSSQCTTSDEQSDSSNLPTSDTSVALDSAREEDTFHCTRPLTEPHLCSETEGFSETGPETETEQVTAEGHPKHKKRRKRRFLSYMRKQHQVKKTGVLKIVDKMDFEDTDSDEDNSESDISIPEYLSLSEEEMNVEDADSSDNEEVPRQVLDSDHVSHPGESAAEKMCDQTPADSDVNVLSLQINMRLLLPDDWSVDIVQDHILRLVHLNSLKKAAVDRNIYFDSKSKAVGIFVHGVPVSPDNRVFKCHKLPDSESIGSISDFLCELATRIKIMVVCTGITEHQELWDVTRGYLDYSSSIVDPCYRSGSCHLLIKGNCEICQSCQVEINRIERELKRRVNDPRTPDKYLSKEDLKYKKDKYKKLYYSEKQRSGRLQKRVDSLQIKLDAVLKDELTSILNANQHKMSDIQKLFWQQQMQALSLDDKRGMRWHPMLIRLALHLHSLSDSAYEFWNNSKVLTLPSKRRLYDYSHFVEPKEGCQEEYLEQIREKIRKCGTDEYFTYINLMFDEMHIRSGLVVKRSTGELIGYTQLDNVEEELTKMQHELNSKIYRPKLAKKILVYMANGICSTVKDVVAIYSTDDLSASQLFTRTWDVMYDLEEAGIKVLTVTCDGASVNRKFIFMHESLDKSSKYIYSTKNLAAGDSRPLFFILDPPHLLKTIRNALANSFSHRKTRKLWKSGEYLSWQVIEELFKLTGSDKHSHKLTKAHIKLTNFSCMTVLFATQVFSDSVANCIERFANHEKMKQYDTVELVKFIRLMNQFFDCVNVKGEGDAAEEEIPIKKTPYSTCDDPRLNFLEHDFLDFFEEWKEDIGNRPGYFTEMEKSRMIISHQGLGALEITVHGLAGAIRFMLEVAKAPSVSARVFNQDPLEQYFSKVRRAQGDNRNPFLLSAHSIRQDLTAGAQVASLTEKGNTQVLKRKEIEIDSSPLATRKIQKKSKDST